MTLFSKGDTCPIAKWIQLGLELAGYTNNGKLIPDGDAGGNTFAAVAALVGKPVNEFTTEDLQLLAQKLLELGHGGPRGAALALTPPYPTGEEICT